jgi:hypothetical protein
MPRTQIIEKTLFKFNELSDQAKDKAREWWRDCETGDHDTSCTYDDAVQCGAILGIEIASRNQKCILTGAKPREWIDRSPAIYYSGFWSQGDGACFEGSYRYAKGAAKKIREHAPQDSELHRIADELQELQRKNFYKITASTKHRGHYYHSGCMSVDVDGCDSDCDSEHYAAIVQLMRDFADWIYSQLEKEWEWTNADEQVDESIRCNEYEFTEEGAIA